MPWIRWFRDSYTAKLRKKGSNVQYIAHYDTQVKDLFILKTDGKVQELLEDNWDDKVETLDDATHWVEKKGYIFEQ